MRIDSQLPGAMGRRVFIAVTLLLTQSLRTLAQPQPNCAEPGSQCSLAATAIQAGAFIGAAVNDPGATAAQSTVPRDFNALTPENAMKWGSLAHNVGQYDFSAADAIADFAGVTGARLRGHTLIWGRTQLPQDLAADVAAAADPAAQLRARMSEHIATVVDRYQGRVALWDVVNEPLDDNSGRFQDNIFFRTLGDGYIAEAFHLARAHDAEAPLFLNEFLFGYSGAKAIALRNLVARLRTAGVPVDGVGIQAHFFPGLPLPTRTAFESYLRSLGDLGVKVEITELDVSIDHFLDAADPLARQAEFYGDIVAACMAVPACQGVTLWGISDGHTWLDTTEPFSASAPNLPLLFDAALQPKPAYAAVQRALARRLPQSFDCNGDGSVSVDDLIVGVTIALDEQPLADCASFDRNGDASVTVEELLLAVRRALES